MIEIQGLTKEFRSKRGKVLALNSIECLIQEKEFVLIKGASGCGKSTLLFTMGGLLKPTTGTIRVMSHDLYTMSSKELLRYRAHNTGFVFQAYHLLPYLSVYENILINNITSGKGIAELEVVQIARQLKIEHRLHHKPSELSAGEKQRVSLARALITKPKIIFADEPTGNLDPVNTEHVLKCLKEYNGLGGTVVMVSHGDEADKYASRQIIMNAGQINN